MTDWLLFVIAIALVCRWTRGWTRGMLIAAIILGIVVNL